MALPLVSVVIPTYNRANLLPDALESVLAQTYQHFEILVVDDGSTDDTLQVLKAYQRVRVLCQDNAGPSAARNHGIRQAKGELVAFLDSDDIWLPKKLESQVLLFQRHPEIGMVGGGCRYIDSKGGGLGGETTCPYLIPLEHFQIFTALPGSASNALIRMDVLEEVGLFDTSLLRAEDRELWMRIAERYPVRGVPEPTVLIRVHTGERPNDSFELKREARRRVNERIRDRTVRRKADAWMWFSFGQHMLSQGRSARAYWYFLRSFLTRPGRISPRNRRLVPFLHQVAPAPVMRLARLIRRRN